MDEPFSISKTGTVECTYCHCEAQVSTATNNTAVTVRCPNPGCQHYGNRNAPRFQIGPCFGGDMVSCPDCGADMEGDEEHDEIWHAPSAMIPTGSITTSTWSASRARRTHERFDMDAEAAAEKEGE